MNEQRKKYALLSVYSKSGIVEFARSLSNDFGFTILASGGTAGAIREGGVAVTDVAELVGGKAILGHKVLTLSREVSAGMLADYLSDLEEMESLGLPFIDIVCFDLYPLKDEIAKAGCTRDSVRAQTDVGGITAIHAGAKGQRIVICRPEQRQLVLEWLKDGKPDEAGFLNELAAEAEILAADYCLSSGMYLSQNKFLGFIGQKHAGCKYGENAYQAPAALYKRYGVAKDPLALDAFMLAAGDALSYNNYCDLDRALQTMTRIAASFDVNRGTVPNIAIGLKHGNACGVGVHMNEEEAIIKMLKGDPLAIFGGTLMCNFGIDGEGAELLLTYQSEKRRLFDVIIAASFTDEAVRLLDWRKDGKCRLVENKELHSLGASTLDAAPRFRYVRGGFMVQPNYSYVLNLNDPNLVRRGNFSREQEDDILLAKAIGDTSNSNTITIVKRGMLMGNGVGQQARVTGAKLAVGLAEASGHSLIEAIASSDSFFPFADGLDVLGDAGVKTVMATSGSKNDNLIIERCYERMINLMMIPDSQGRGFFGH